MRSATTSHQPVQTEALEGPEEGLVLCWGWFSGSGGLPGETVVAPEVSSPDRPLCVLLGQYGLLSLPFSLQFSLVHPEPGVRDFLAGAGKASPPANAPPASEAAPADRLAPLVHSLGAGGSGGGGAFTRHTAGELLQGGTQRHEGIHVKSCLVAGGVVVKSGGVSQALQVASPVDTIS